MTVIGIRKPERASAVGVPDEAQRAELRARVAASRAAQGLPPYITDEVTLSKIAALLAVGRPIGGFGGSG